MFGSHGEKDQKYRQQWHPHTAQKTTPEACKQPGNTVLKIQMAGLRHPRGPLSLVCIHTYTYIFFLFGIFKYKFTYIRRKMRT